MMVMVLGRFHGMEQAGDVPVRPSLGVGLGVLPSMHTRVPRPCPRPALYSTVAGPAKLYRFMYG